MFITHDDLTPFATIEAAKAVAMIADVEARALAAAPCLATIDLEDAENALKLAQVKAVLRSVILRWNDVGSGARQSVSEQVGPFSRTEGFGSLGSRPLLTPQEIAELRDVCAGATTTPRAAYTVDMAGGTSPTHQPWCSLMFLATYCSCGADLTQGQPLWEY